MCVRAYVIALLCLTLVQATKVEIRYKRDKHDKPIETGQLYVDDYPFFIRGVNYNPIPIGSDPNIKNDWYTVADRDVWARDIPILRDLKVNVIRMYGWTNFWDHKPFLDQLYNNGFSPIYVILTFWFPKQDLTDPIRRSNLFGGFTQMVGLYKDHPAILMWMVGNELNSPDWYGSSPEALDSAMSLVDDMANIARNMDPNHIVSTPLYDKDVINVIQKYDTKMKYLDLWSVQLYRGKDFGTFFTDYKPLTVRPVFMSEYGIDAFDDRTQTEQPALQTEYNMALLQILLNTRDICVGGAVFEYSDEWWKGRDSIKDGRHPDCPSSDPTKHNNCGHPASGPDSYSNEEWYGLMSVSNPDNAGPDILDYRPAFYAIQSVYAELAAKDPAAVRTRLGLIIAVSITAGLLGLALVLFGISRIRKWRRRRLESMQMMTDYQTFSHT